MLVALQHVELQRVEWSIFFILSLKTANSFTCQDCLRYLIGLLSISVGRISNGFQLLYEIECQSLFPRNLIQNSIIPLLSQQMKETLFEADFFVNAPEWRKMSETTLSHYFSSCSMDIIEEDFIDYHDLSNCQKRMRLIWMHSTIYSV